MGIVKVRGANSNMYADDTVFLLCFGKLGKDCVKNICAELPAVDRSQ